MGVVGCNNLWDATIQVELINDFVAQGYGMLTLGDDEAEKTVHSETIPETIETV